MWHQIGTFSKMMTSADQKRGCMKISSLGGKALQLICHEMGNGRMGNTAVPEQSDLVL